MIAQQIRKQIRQQRRALSLEAQELAAWELRAQLKSLPGFITARHVAVYLANDGEIAPRLVTSWLWQTSKCVYLPLLSDHPEGEMLFGEYLPDCHFSYNQFGIPEPICQPEQKHRAGSLDIILLPLVAFDDAGNRLGMGGGYYDRTLAFRQRQTYTRRPKLVGIAHHFQQVEEIHAEAWDVPLDAVVTDQATLIF